MFTPGKKKSLSKMAAEIEMLCFQKEIHNSTLKLI